MENKRNYYRILHVQPDAPVELIRMSYRTIMQKLRKHPDLGGDEWDASVINEAYAVLSDSKLRAAYDKRLLKERSMEDAASQSEGQRAGADSGGQGEKSADQAEANTGQNKTQSGEHTARARAHQQKERDTEPPGQDRSQARQPPPDSSSNDEAPEHACRFCHTAYSSPPQADSDCLQCNSPLLPLSRKALETSGKRLIERQPNHCPLDVYPFWPSQKHPAVLQDLSLHGLKFLFHEALSPRHVLKIDCPLFVAVAEVAHCEQQQHAYMLGAKFLSIRFASQRGTFVQTSA